MVTSLKDVAELEVKYESSIQSLCDWIGRGIAAGVYTQTTDVECEVNGLLSYDRRVQKLSPTFLAKVHSSLWEKCAQLTRGRMKKDPADPVVNVVSHTDPEQTLAQI